MISFKSIFLGRLMRVLLGLMQNSAALSMYFLPFALGTQTPFQRDKPYCRVRRPAGR